MEGDPVTLIIIIITCKAMEIPTMKTVIECVHWLPQMACENLLCVYVCTWMSLTVSLVQCHMSVILYMSMNTVM